MDFLMNSEWWQQNGLTVFLVALSLVQWIALQALAIHYHFFRKNLKRPKPDAIRMDMMEKTIALQSEQIEKIFSKLAHFNREIDQLHVKQSSTSRKGMDSNTGSIESSMATLGEIALKQRIQELKGSGRLSAS